MKALTVVIASGWALAYVLGVGCSTPVEAADSLLVVTSPESVSGIPAIARCPGFMLSPQEMLVKVPRQNVAFLGTAEGIKVLGTEPELPLWIVGGDMAPDVAAEAGVSVFYRGRNNTVFEASRDNAYGLLEKGYLIAEMDLAEISGLVAPHFGQTLATELLSLRPLTQARKRFVKALSESVSAANITDVIYSLSYDEAAGKYRSRFATRTETRQEIVPYIGDKLGSYVIPNGGTLREQEFKPLVAAKYSTQDSIMVNIIADKPGRKTAARYIICAHYDAICTRADWNWETDPAPGADDNASGIAGVLECARLLSGLDLDVGLTFIAFAGEELALLGSKEYVAQLAAQDSIIGVINLDMIGHVATSPVIEVVYDYKSKWLTDQLVEMSDTLGVAGPVEPVDHSGIADSDHWSFWAAGIPANMLIDGLEDIDGKKGGPTNPYYHSTADTLGTLTIAQVCDNVRLVSGFLARFAAIQEDTLSDLALSQGSIEWKWPGRPYLPITPGDSITAIVRVLNRGGSMRKAEHYNFEIWTGESHSGELLHQASLTLKVLSGEYGELRASWRVDPRRYGHIPFAFVIEPLDPGIESDISNNVLRTILDVMPRTTVVENLHVYPNPAEEPSGAKLSFEILHPRSDFTGKMEVWIFDLGGNQIGHGTLERSHLGTPEIAIGQNAIGLDRFLPNDPDLPPGLYACIARLRLTGEDTAVWARSKFAVVR